MIFFERSPKSSLYSFYSGSVSSTLNSNDDDGKHFSLSFYFFASLLVFRRYDEPTYSVLLPKESASSLWTTYIPNSQSWSFLPPFPRSFVLAYSYADDFVFAETRTELMRGKKHGSEPMVSWDRLTELIGCRWANMWVNFCLFLLHIRLCSRRKQVHPFFEFTVHRSILLCPLTYTLCV